MTAYKKCDTSKCHAACCYNVPMEKGYISAYRKRIVNPVLRMEPQGDDKSARNVFGSKARAQYIMRTSEDVMENKCPFLRQDCRCNIYVQRPVICRRFGDPRETQRFLNCQFLSGVETKVTREEIINLLTR